MAAKRGRSAGAIAPRGPRGSPPRGTPTPAWVGLAAALLACAARLVPWTRLPFYNDDFVYLDDASRRPLLDALVHPVRLGGYLRPLSRAAHFGIAWRAFGLDPAKYHLTNLVLVLACVALVWALARRYLSPRGALVGAALFGLSHAQAVLVGWVSCDQDLWALLFALLSALLLARGRGLPSAACFGLALLAKENVALLPLALFALAAQREPWRRAARRVLPHVAVLAAWAAWYAACRVPGRSAPWDAGATAALPLRLLLAGLGVEAPRLWWRAFPALPGAGVLVAVLVLGATLWLQPRSAARGTRAWPWLLWAALGLIPVLPVAGPWSAYFFALPLAGLSLAAAAASEAWPGAALAPLPLALLLTTQATLSLRINPTAPLADPWLSSVSPARLALTAELSRSAAAQITELLPNPPDHALLLFNGLPTNIGLISGDGPAIRLMYANPTLGACYTGEIGDRTDFRRPLYLFSWTMAPGRFSLERVDRDNFRLLALGLELGRHPQSAAAAGRYLVGQLDPSPEATWNLGYALWESGDSAGAEALWRRAASGSGRALPPAGGLAARLRSLPDPQSRYALLLDALLAAPRDASLLLRAAREGAALADDFAAVLYLRACLCAPRSAPLLREAAAAMRAAHLTAAQALADSLLRAAAGPGPG
ncbi:MAG TPA: glycosyltransferase family 39 protein [Candidatus Saccharimonadales bacterium]|nr:glycosyltransferase family 39 protein [Candidatus Saccharimonadales bacterium]